jgi:hypothetical protein
VTELRPLLESCEDELERALLRSAHADAPGPLGLRETALALGLTTVTANALAASVPTATALLQAAPLSATSGAATASAATSTAVTSALGGASLGVLGKGLLGGALVSFLALSTLDQTVGTSSSPAPRAVAAGAVSARTAQPGPPAAPPTPAITAASDFEATVDAEADAASASRRPSPRVPRPAATGTDTPRSTSAPARADFESIARPQPAPGVAPNASLAAEIRTLDQARAALSAGDTQRAELLLDQYGSRRPGPTLAQEAALLRVRLLLARGQRPAAAELARRIIAQHAGSAHVDSLRRLAAEP